MVVMELPGQQQFKGLLTQDKTQNPLALCPTNTRAGERNAQALGDGHIGGEETAASTGLCGGGHDSMCGQENKKKKVAGMQCKPPRPPKSPFQFFEWGINKEQVRMKTVGIKKHALFILSRYLFLSMCLIWTASAAALRCFQ